MNGAGNNEFFIGWQSRQPDRTRKTIRTLVAALLLVGVVLAVVFATVQRAPALAAYEWTNVQTFEGILRKGPYPHLLVSRGSGGAYSAYPLVAETKFGVAAEWCGDLDGRPVRFDGGLIYRAGGTLIEIVSEAPTPVEGAFVTVPSSEMIDFGTRTLVGEIVDAKCYLGAMNPGRYKPHRACATVCVAGGIPPMLVVNAPDGAAATFLLVGEDSELINEQVLDLLARPVRVTGRLTLSHDLWIMSADPQTIEQL